MEETPQSANDKVYSLNLRSTQCNYFALQCGVAIDIEDILNDEPQNSGLLSGDKYKVIDVYSGPHGTTIATFPFLSGAYEFCHEKKRRWTRLGWRVVGCIERDKTYTCFKNLEAIAKVSIEKLTTEERQQLGRTLYDYYERKTVR